MKKNMMMIILLFTIILSGIACNTAETFSKPTPTLTPTKTFTPSPTFTPTITSTPTIPPLHIQEQGFSNLYGRVLWRGEPLKDFVMQLKGSSGPDRTYTTNSEGLFSFTGLQSGDYTLSGVIAGSELEGTAAVWEDKVTVNPDTNQNYGEYWLLETDLILLDPAQGSETDEIRPSFKWEAYPGAAYYMLKLRSGVDEYIDLDTRVESLEYNLQKPLIACTYNWDVIAYDDSGIPLARSNAFYFQNESPHNPYYDGFFSVNNNALGSCYIKLVSPQDNATVTGPQMAFKWEKQPLVVRYHLHIRKLSCVGFGLGPCTINSPQSWFNFFSGDFMLQEDGTLTGPTLPTFRYYPGVIYYSWNITGYDQDGLLVAHSGTNIFYIR